MRGGVGGVGGKLKKMLGGMWEETLGGGGRGGKGGGGGGEGKMVVMTFYAFLVDVFTLL